MRNPFSRNSQMARSPGDSDNGGTYPPQVPEPSGSVKTKQYNLWGFNPFMFMPRKWERVRQIDVNTFKNYSLNDLLDMLSVCHPEVSYALWQYLRVANSTITCKAKGVRGNDDARGQKVLDGLLWKLNHPPTGNQFEESRGVEKLSLQLILNTLLRGSAGCELVLNNAGTMERLVPFDSGTISYKTENERVIPYQWQGGLGGDMGWVPLDYPNIFIYALDEAIGDPYGRNPFASVPAMVAFQLGFLNDLKAATHQVGYPRLKATLVEEAFANNLPPQIRNDPKQYKEWADNYKRQIEANLRNLEPDSILTAWDTVTLDMVGKGGSGATIRVDAVISVIERSLAASLKTMLTILGRGIDSSKESYAAELKLYSRGIESVQKVVESLFERALTLALNLEGVRGWVDVTFAPVDLRSELQVVAELQTRQDIITFARDCGDISDLEQTNMIRSMFGLVGLPDGWEQMKAEAADRRNNTGLEANRHGSPPATQ